MRDTRGRSAVARHARRTRIATLALATSIALGIADPPAHAQAPARTFDSSGRQRLVFTIEVRQVGATRRQIEADVTRRILQAMDTLPGAYLTSNDQDGLSRVRLEFDVNADAQSIAREVQRRLAAVRPTLPPAANEPVFFWGSEKSLAP